MNLSLIPAPEELAIVYDPSTSSSRTIGEPIAVRVIAVLYLLLLVTFQLPPDGRPPDAPSNAAATAPVAEDSCEECIRVPLYSRQTKD